MPSYKKLRISGPAADDLTHIADYTQRQWGKPQKQKYLTLIRDKFKTLTQPPHLGTLRDDITPALRSLLAGKHIIFYRETKTTLEIVRVLHESMDVGALRPRSEV